MIAYLIPILIANNIGMNIVSIFFCGFFKQSPFRDLNLKQNSINILMLSVLLIPIYPSFLLETNCPIVKDIFIGSTIYWTLISVISIGTLDIIKYKRIIK